MQASKRLSFGKALGHVMAEVTSMLNDLSVDRRQSAEELFALVYQELRRLAVQKLAHEQPGQTLQPTALVHEAFLRLVGAPNRDGFENRCHFFAAASEAMRRILVENARRKKALCHGGDWKRVEFDNADFPQPVNP